MYEIAICDDDAVFAAGLKKQVLALMEARSAPCRVTLYADPDALLRALESGERQDLIFQDVMFGREKGIAFAKTLRERRWDADVVFVTVSAEYAIDAYAAYPLNYLLKPIARDRLSEVLDHFLEKRAPRSLRLATPKSIIRLATADVLFFEIFDHTILIHKTDGGSETLTGTLKEIESALPPRCFVRPHRSYLVNLEHVREIARYRMILSSGDEVPVSKELYRKVQLSLIEYDDRLSLAR